MAISAHREHWLRTLDALADELRRPPSSTELARALDIDRASVRQLAVRAARDGLVILGPASATTPRGLRLTPAARIALGLPLAVYLAWPSPEVLDLGDAATPGRMAAAWSVGAAAAAELTQRFGLFCCSPLLVIEAIGRPGAMEAATAAATALHAAIAWRDPLLVGRRDLDTARRAGVPVAVAAGPMPATAGELWVPPRLVPPLADGG